jgi:hypothetical protein
VTPFELLVIPFKLRQPLLHILQSRFSLEKPPDGLGVVGEINSVAFSVHKQIFERDGLSEICIHRGSHGRLASSSSFERFFRPGHFDNDEFIKDL